MPLAGAPPFLSIRVVIFPQGQAPVQRHVLAIVAAAGCSDRGALHHAVPASAEGDFPATVLSIGYGDTIRVR
jgi:hypothetical protein